MIHWRGHVFNKFPGRSILQYPPCEGVIGKEGKICLGQQDPPLEVSLVGIHPRLRGHLRGFGFLPVFHVPVGRQLKQKS